MEYAESPASSDAGDSAYTIDLQDITPDGAIASLYLSTSTNLAIGERQSGRLARLPECVNLCAPVLQGLILRED